MSLQPRRSSVTLFLLVITPVALLVWLGTYLIRDAARSTDSAREAILEERLIVADHQLLHDLRHFTDELDRFGVAEGTALTEAARQVGEHAWVAEVWISAPDAVPTTVVDKKTLTPTAEAQAAPVSAALRDQLRINDIAGPVISTNPQPFVHINTPPDQSSTRISKGVWQTAIKSLNYHLDSGLPIEASFASGWHVSDGDFIYWRLVGDEILCARVDGRKLGPSLFARLPLPGMENYAGRLTLTTTTGIPLHGWGLSLAGPELAASRRLCSAPLNQWQLSYTPTLHEFPKPYLFPIMLGVGSGCLLVWALAWTFFRENAREIRVAQQRVSFVNQISHELKTPLTNIRLYTEMASHRIEQAGDTIGKRHLGVVETEVARLDRLIQNVLIYARQQRDKLNVQPRPISLDHVVERAVNHWRLLLERKGFELDTRLVGPNEMTADPDAIEQILGNLISNVDKYAAYGKYIAVRTEQDVEKSVARVIVEDRGPGIPLSKRNMVFEPFERLRSDLNEGVSGTGIGLTISRELAELHGGSLDVCPNYKEGSRFILTLPLQAKKS
ncbi:sensor histidine kinase [Brevifollis gellanilyticus]|uniref:histidine kinase n=1 Tax=Brevifollis gellanilyticus TaxID=748831 RepID=A0A512ME37_9BACT|nr:HAMP domain-containing sensor histidine kinase [Brevifollis gellanilyticus]GEP44952.1 two-component sensor histidine kinase [Brevifollis gellanilyticus]